MKILSLKPELTFDDVLILPNKSNFVIEDDYKNTEISTKVSKNLKIDIPITSSPMPRVTEVQMAITLGKMGGLGFLHTFQSFSQQLAQAREVKKHKVKVAVSVADLTDKGLKHVGKLLKAGVDLICVETAQAHNKQTLSFIRKIKKSYPKAEVCASLIVTEDSVEDLIKAGADSIRVGIGGGSHCTTRLVTGIGRPQLTAVEKCVKIAKKYKVPVISDTGIRYAGDIAKALAFGANAVMIGGLFAGAYECPGKIIKKNGKYYKKSWGMCSKEAWYDVKNPKNSFGEIKQKIKEVIKDVVFHKPTVNHNGFEEGVSGLIPYQGSVKPLVEKLNSGLKRSMWYVGATSIEELRKKARVVIVTPNTMMDNIPRI